MYISIANSKVYSNRFYNSRLNKRFRKLFFFSISLLLIFILSGISLQNAQAQISQTIYFMDRLPQSSLINPAYQHHHNFHLGLPAVSSFNVNARTNFANFNDIVFKHPQYDSLITFLHPDANSEDFTSRLSNRNFFAPDLHINLFSFGFRANRSFVSFNLSERVSGRGMLPKDLLLLGLQGNEQFVGEKADFSNIGIDMNYYREYALGYAYDVDDKLNVGARAKILFGKANISFSDMDISLNTDADTYNMDLKSKFTMNFSMPVTLVKDEEGEISDIEAHFDMDDYDPLDFVFNTNNSGFAIDLGASYRLTDPVTLHASILDLGYINWKDDVYNLSMDGEFEFDGVDISSIFDSSDDSEPGEDLLETIQDRFSISDTRNSYRRGLPTRLYLGGTYELSSRVGFGMLSRTQYYQKNFEQAMTLSANANLGRWLSASLSYSMMNNSYNNIGAGLSLGGAGIQLYVLTDNLNSVFHPHKTNSVNLWFGLNLIFGSKRQKEISSDEPEMYDVPISDPPTTDSPDDDLNEEELNEKEPEDQESLNIFETEAEEISSASGLEIIEVDYQDAGSSAFFHYIVAGSFKNPKYAESYVEMMQNMGYQADILDSDNGMYRVHIHVYGDYDEALQMLDNLRAREDSPPVWMLSK